MRSEALSPSLSWISLHTNLSIIMLKVSILQTKDIEHQVGQVGLIKICPFVDYEQNISMKRKTLA
jgi:hypothetical protein